MTRHFRVEKLTNNSDIITAAAHINTDVLTAAAKEHMFAVLIGHGRVFVIFEGDRLVGYVSFIRDWDDQKRAFLLEMSLLPEVHNSGAEVVLLRHALRCLQADGVNLVQLTVKRQNTQARRLYQDMFGFINLGPHGEDYHLGQDYCVLVRELATEIPIVPTLLQ